MRGRKPNETDAAYIARLEASNVELRKQNKLAGKVAQAVTWLACDASLAFQAMAEKAGVRNHPSVSAVVKAFDTIQHPQWTPDDATIGDLTFPGDWDFDAPNAWSGDADMELNSPIKAVLEYLESQKFARGSGAKQWEHISQLQTDLEKPLQGALERIRPELAERKPLAIPDDATRDDLADAINAMSWRALDLAQDMNFANEMLRRDLRAAAYRRVCGDLYEMSNMIVPQRDDRPDVKVLGGEIPF